MYYFPVIKSKVLFYVGDREYSLTNKHTYIIIKQWNYVLYKHKNHQTKQHKLINLYHSNSSSCEQILCIKINHFCLTKLSFPVTMTFTYLHPVVSSCHNCILFIWRNLSIYLLIYLSAVRDYKAGIWTDNFSHQEQNIDSWYGD